MEQEGQSYLEYIFISGATVCVVRHISDYSIFFHSYCPHRHHHLLSSQNSCVQDVRVLQRGKSAHIDLFYILDIADVLLQCKCFCGGWEHRGRKVGNECRRDRGDEVLLSSSTDQRRRPVLLRGAELRLGDGLVTTGRSEPILDFSAQACP